MADTTNCTHCVACDCPALPRVTFDQAVIDLMESIALQESALSHILVLKEKLEFIANNLYYPSTDNNTCTTTES